MTRARATAAATVALAALGLATASALAASNDNNVEHDGVSHLPDHDRRPLCPTDGESFTVRFQTFRDDVTSASVIVSGDVSGTFAATRVSSHGPYDVWSAGIPASSPSARLAYHIALTDGTDTDYLSTFGITGSQPVGLDWAIDFMTLEHAPLGATPATLGTVFRVWAPGVSEAWVQGSFNAWALNYPMNRIGNDFIRHVPLAFSGSQYRYNFDGSFSKADARARSLVETSPVTSKVFDPGSHTWSSESFTPAPLEEWVIYELHVGSFSGLNDPVSSAPWPSRYRDVTARVSHLQELGVNAVMLNPINEFAGELSGGYNPISAWAIESALGNPRDFMRMVDALHEAGIAVILDVVWNHFDSFNNYLWYYTGDQIYFDVPQVDTPWGPQADYDDANVRDYFVDAAALLLDEFRLDGFRVDAVFETIYGVQSASGQLKMKDIARLKDRRADDGMLLGEIYDDNAWNTVPVSSGGLGLDTQYHNNYKQAVRGAIFAAAFGDPNVSYVADVLDGTGDVAGTRAFNYFELHDEAWSLSGTERAVKTIDNTWPHDDEFAKGRTKLANGLTLLSRGVPGILQGAEWLEDNEWEQQKIDWSHKTTYAGIFDFYKTLINLRTSDPALFANSNLDVIHVNEGANVIAFRRFDDDGNEYLAVANFSNIDFTSYRLGLPRDGDWTEVINSEDPAFMGDGPVNDPIIVAEPIGAHGQAQSAELKIAARSLILLAPAVPAPACAGDVNGDGVTDVFDFSDLAAGFGAGPGATRAQGDLTGDGLVDVFDFAALAGDFGCVAD
jgi:1,4-alpha-glucan branching enzyme